MQMDSFAHSRSCSGSVKTSSGTSKYLRTCTRPFLVIYENDCIPACSYFLRAASSTTKYRLFPIIMANCTKSREIPIPPKNRPVRTVPIGFRCSKTYSVYSALGVNGLSPHPVIRRIQPFALAAHQPRTAQSLPPGRVCFPDHLPCSNVQDSDHDGF